MSKTPEELANILLEQLDEVSKIYKIDKALFMLMYSEFQNTEQSFPMKQYLIENKEVDIDTIKRTKYAFHQIIYHYFLLNQENFEANNNVNERCFEVSETMRDLADLQNKVAKLPTIDELRKQDGEKKNISN